MYRPISTCQCVFVSLKRIISKIVQVALRSRQLLISMPSGEQMFDPRIPNLATMGRKLLKQGPLQQVHTAVLLKLSPWNVLLLLFYCLIAIVLVWLSHCCCSLFLLGHFFVVISWLAYPQDYFLHKNSLCVSVFTSQISFYVHVFTYRLVISAFISTSISLPISIISLSRHVLARLYLYLRL